MRIRAEEATARQTRGAIKILDANQRLVLARRRSPSLREVRERLFGTRAAGSVRAFSIIRGCCVGVPRVAAARSLVVVVVAADKSALFCSA